jgi:protein SCO1/2
VIGAAGLGAMYYFSSSQPKGAGITLTDAEPTPLSEHQIGEFEVMDHLGNRFSQNDLLGTFSVIFFGNIEHEGRRARLLQMAEAVMQSDRLSNMQHLKPVFVTLKPKEDDVVKLNAMVEDYASALNRKDVLGVRLKALVGDDNLKLHAAAQKFTHEVKGKPGANPETATKDDGGDFYFVNPDGEFIASYGPHISPREMAEEWADTMKGYKLKHPSWLSPKKVATRHA